VAGDRLRALGQELVRVHDGLRDDLARLRTAVAAGGPVPQGRSPVAHCLAFCAALTRHHTAEDATAFPALAARHPDLAPIVAKLVEDHAMISGIVGRVEAISADLAAGAEAPRLLGELDGLSAILESHFRFEERRIADALDGLDLSAAEALGAEVSQPGG
jgi:Hemerythrin HHE cation binding domain